MNIKEIYQIYLQFPNVQTDSRKLQKDDLFFALKGPNFNANDFAKQALDLGAAYVIVDEAQAFQDKRIILVNDVLQTLQDLAKYHRNQFTIPFIAITGSNGKTTTKELLHEVLSTSFVTYTTTGNLNNHIGIPLTILKIKKDAEIAVIEMGANHRHEIEDYCAYTQPTHGLITNIGKAHLEGFGGVEGVKKGKGELFDYLNAHDKFAFVNEDDTAVADLGRQLKNTISYGSNSKNVFGKIISNSPFIEVEIGGEKKFYIQTRLVGNYNLPNILAAVCAGKYFSVTDQKIKQAIENYEPTNSRSQLLQRGSNTIILDAYNANPSSMKLAIENFATIKSPTKILLLGDMKELGDDSIKEHQAIVSLIQQFAWQHVVLVGENFAATQHSYIDFKNVLEAKDWLDKQAFKNSYILVKGSRSLQMEKVLES